MPRFLPMDGVRCEPDGVSWTDRLPAGLQRLAALAVDVDDPEDLRLDKGMLTLVSSLIAVMSFAWIAIYLAIGLPWSAAVPFAFQSCSSRSRRCSRTRSRVPLPTSMLGSVRPRSQ